MTERQLFDTVRGFLYAGVYHCLCTVLSRYRLCFELFERELTSGHDSAESDPLLRAMRDMQAEEVDPFLFLLELCSGTPETSGELAAAFAADPRAYRASRSSGSSRTFRGSRASRGQVPSPADSSGADYSAEGPAGDSLAAEGPAEALPRGRSELSTERLLPVWSHLLSAAVTRSGASLCCAESMADCAPAELIRLFVPAAALLRTVRGGLAVRLERIAEPPGEEGCMLIRTEDGRRLGRRSGGGTSQTCRRLCARYGCEVNTETGREERLLCRLTEPFPSLVPPPEGR
jgi:hypothetical protein